MENHLQPVADCAHLNGVMRNLWYLCLGAGKYYGAVWGKSKSGWNLNTWCLLFTLANRSVHGLGKWWAKFKTIKFRPGITFTISVYKSVPFTKKWPRRPEHGIKDGFEETEHELPCVTIPPGKTVLLFRRYVALGKFPPKRPGKSCSIYFPTGLTETFVNDKQPHLLLKSASSFSALFITRVDVN